VPPADDEAPVAALGEEPAPDVIPFEAEPRAQDPDSEPELPVTAPPVAAAEPVSMPEPAEPEPAPQAAIEPEPEPEPAPAAAAPAAAAPAAAAATPGGSEPLPWPTAPKPANPPIPT